MKSRIVLYGAGGHGKVVADIVEKQGQYELVGFIDDEASGNVCGFPVLGGRDETKTLRRSDIEYAIATVGDSQLREVLDERLLDAGFSLGIAVHPSAQTAKGAFLGEGTVVMPGAVIGPDAVLGRSCIVNTVASVDHDCELGDYVHVAPGARLGGGVRVGNHVLIGIGAAVREGSSIGKHSVVGMGAAVTSDIPNGVVAVGVPARVVRKTGQGR